MPSAIMSTAAGSTSNAASRPRTFTSSPPGKLGVAIEDCVIIEDSRVGATGALASGARVIGLAAGAHCLAGHDEMLRSLGVADIAHDFDELRRLAALD